MSETYDKIEITNPDGTKRGITDADFKSHKTLECGCRISTGGLGWLMTQYRACKPDCPSYLLWKRGELDTETQ